MSADSGTGGRPEGAAQDATTYADGDSDGTGGLQGRGGIEEIYRRHGGAVHGLAARFCEPSHAADITVEVFMGVGAFPSASPPEPTSQRTVLMAAAHARAVAALRADRRRAAWLAQSSAVHVEEECLARAGEEARRTLSEIAPLERQAVTLAYFGGLTCRAVASLTGQPEQVVRRAIADGLAHLSI